MEKLIVNTESNEFDIHCIARIEGLSGQQIYVDETRRAITGFETKELIRECEEESYKEITVNKDFIPRYMYKWMYDSYKKVPGTLVEKSVKYFYVKDWKVHNVEITARFANKFVTSINKKETIIHEVPIP